MTCLCRILSTVRSFSCQFQLHFVGRLREDREMVDLPGPGAPLCGPKAGASAVAFKGRHTNPLNWWSAERVFSGRSPTQVLFDPFWWCVDCNTARSIMVFVKRSVAIDDLGRLAGLLHWLRWCFELMIMLSLDDIQLTRHIFLGIPGLYIRPIPRVISNNFSMFFLAKVGEIHRNTLRWPIKGNFGLVSDRKSDPFISAQKVALSSHCHGRAPCWLPWCGEVRPEGWWRKVWHGYIESSAMNGMKIH